jgi:hypothetical protein
MMCDVRRKIAGNETFKERVADPSRLAERVRFGSPAAPPHGVFAARSRAECSQRAVRVWLQGVGDDPATTPKAGQFVLRAKALHGNSLMVTSWGRCSPSWTR